MEHDLWRQWQAFAAGAAPSFAGGAGAAPAGAFGFAPFIEAAEHFAAATRRFHEGSAGGSAPAATAAAQVLGNFLRDQFADLFKMPGGAQPWGDAPPSGTDHALPAELPALGLTREHQERAQRAAQAWRGMVEAQRRLQRLWLDTLREAASAFVARLGAAQSAPLTPDTLNRLYDSWIDCAEESYAHTAHSEAFCDALADYVNASSQWRRESNAGAEYWAKLLDMPTRNEINTLAQRLRALEERVQAQTGARETEARQHEAPQPEAPQPEAPQPEAPQPEARQHETRPPKARQPEARPTDARKERGAARKRRPPRMSKP
jgi:class III poly(R)-hydroxyalkanoic acid synthase PhaE subunit